MEDNEFILALGQKLKEDLPAYSAQSIMEPPLRNTLDLDSSNAKKAATILILYYEKEWKFLLIKRSSHPLDKHKGQISFPGGSLEKGESSKEAAIREAEEEIGVQSTQIEILGKLSDLFIPVSNFIVSPYVSIGQDISLEKLVKQESEVADIISISLKDFLDESAVKFKTMTMPNGFVLKKIPVFKIEGEIIWGATAMMLSEFKEIVKKILD